jgi:hypothetical protein
MRAAQPWTLSEISRNASNVGTTDSAVVQRSVTVFSDGRHYPLAPYSVTVLNSLSEDLWCLLGLYICRNRGIRRYLSSVVRRRAA